MSQRLRILILLTLAAPLTSGCGEDDLPGPEPGWMTVDIESPHEAEGAAMLLFDQPVGGVSYGPVHVYMRDVDGGVRVAAVREVPGGLDFRIQVEDVWQPPTVQLLQVAGPDNELRADLEGYSVELRR